jgi:hypothetical protein
MLFGGRTPPQSNALAWDFGHLVVDGRVQVVG